MGSGKSAVGAALARRLGRSFVDIDAAVERRLGMAIHEIFELEGEAAFRDTEQAELRRVSAADDLVVATGGGLFSDRSNRELIEKTGGTSVFLDQPWDVIIGRLGDHDTGRPKFVDPRQAHALYLRRLPDYLEATVRLQVRGDEGPLEVAGRIADVLAEAACAS